MYFLWPIKQSGHLVRCWPLGRHHWGHDGTETVYLLQIVLEIFYSTAVAGQSKSFSVPNSLMFYFNYFVQKIFRPLLFYTWSTSVTSASIAITSTRTGPLHWDGSWCSPLYLWYHSGQLDRCAGKKEPSNRSFPHSLSIDDENFRFLANNHCRNLTQHCSMLQRLMILCRPGGDLLSAKRTKVIDETVAELMPAAT